MHQLRCQSELCRCEEAGCEMHATTPERPGLEWPGLPDVTAAFQKCWGPWGVTQHPAMASPKGPPYPQPSPMG